MNESLEQHGHPDGERILALQRIVDGYIKGPQHTRDFIDYHTQFLSEEQQSELRTAFSLFGLLTLEERLKAVKYDYEREVLLSIDRAKSKEEQSRTKLEAFAAIDVLIELGVFTSDRYEALSDEINRIFERR